MMSYKVDPHLNRIEEVKPFPARSSVGFEWKKIEARGIEGVNIYRGNPTRGRQSLKLIGTTKNRYTTHFVDSDVKPDSTYIYTFTTYALGKESKHGSVLKVKTPPALKEVGFFTAYAIDRSAIKLLWSPHRHESIAGYVIQRSVNGGPWRFVANIKGRLMVEYIDTFVRRGNSYRYRIYAKSFDKVLSKPRKTDTLAM